MSRITKFLKQTCLWESRTGLNKYGENEYAPPEEVKCRRETFTRDVVDTNGFIIKSASRYFLDDTVEVLCKTRNSLNLERLELEIHVCKLRLWLAEFERAMQLEK